MKYIVNLQFERVQSIEVEAESREDAIDIVANGEFEKDQIINEEDDYVEVISVVKSE